MSEIEPTAPVFGISVTAALTGVQPHALRDYEAKGLLEPFRTEGGTRRYSRADVDRVQEVSALLDEGLNLAGVRRVLDMQAETDRLRSEIDRLRGDTPAR